MNGTRTKRNEIAFTWNTLPMNSYQPMRAFSSKHSSFNRKRKRRKKKNVFSVVCVFFALQKSRSSLYTVHLAVWRSCILVIIIIIINDTYYFRNNTPLTALWMTCQCCLQTRPWYIWRYDKTETRHLCILVGADDDDGSTCFPIHVNIEYETVISSFCAASHHVCVHNVPGNH